jgi:hypothetical protein
MLANQIGLSTKVVSERHFIASQTKLTAGEAAKKLSKLLKFKISAKEIIAGYKNLNGRDPEWHHSGFYKSAKGSTMGRTFFFDENDIQFLSENWVIIESIENEHKTEIERKKLIIVFGFYYAWDYNYSGNYGKKVNFKVLKTFTGSVLNTPRNFTACDENVYELAKTKEGKKYFGWDEPKISDFI